MLHSFPSPYFDGFGINIINYASDLPHLRYLPESTTGSQYSLRGMTLVIRIATDSFDIVTIFFENSANPFELATSSVRGRHILEQDHQLKQPHVLLPVLGRGSAVLRFEATRKVSLGGEADGFRRVANRASCQQIFERFGQAVGSDELRWSAARQ